MRTRLVTCLVVALACGLATLTTTPAGARPARKTSRPASRAPAPAPRPPTMNALRAWSAPANTRLVLEMSTVVPSVAPDSGVASELVVRLLARGLERATDMPESLDIGDDVVDSIRVAILPEGAELRVWFRQSTAFRVFTLAAGEGRPFRIVVDAAKPGAAAEEAARLARIATAKVQSRTRIVSVDAGHGGEDPGARGPHGVLEKHVTLAVARALVAELNRMPGIQGVLTRDGDYFIPLRDRYRIAEKVKADLFISVHANSSRRWTQRDRGSEVYFLSLTGASDQADRDLADLENAADLVGGVPTQAEDDLVNLLYDVKRSSALQQSQLLAESLLDNMAADRRLASRGVKQAGFAVLKSVEFPSVLVETAFINNPTEAKLLASPEFQRQMGRQLAEGVREFFSRAGVGLAAPGRGSSSQTAQ